jgi:hypothetical protein
MNWDWTYPRVSKAAGFSTVKRPYPTMEKAEVLLAQVEAGEFDAAVQVMQLYRGLPSPEDDHERAVLGVIMKAFAVVGRRR